MSISTFYRAQAQRCLALSQACSDRKQGAQLSFMALDRPALRPYGSPELGSHYQGQEAATESRYEGSGERGPVRGAPVPREGHRPRARPVRGGGGRAP